MSKSIDHDEILRQVTARLRERFPDADDATIESTAREELDALWGRSVQDYLIVLTERAAKKRLKR